MSLFACKVDSGNGSAHNFKKKYFYFSSARYFLLRVGEIH